MVGPLEGSGALRNRGSQRHRGWPRGGGSEVRRGGGAGPAWSREQHPEGRCRRAAGGSEESWGFEVTLHKRARWALRGTCDQPWGIAHSELGGGIAKESGGEGDDQSGWGREGSMVSALGG